MRDCIEEGILQSYVDNELSPEAARGVEAHAASCQTCAAALEEARAETLMFAEAFAAELALEVPTVRLREKIDAAIAQLERPVETPVRQQGWSFSAWLSSLAAGFRVSPQRALGFASLVAVIAFAAIFAVIKLRPAAETNNAPSQMAESNVKKPAVEIAKTTPTPSTSKTENGGNTPDEKGPEKTPNKNNKPKKPAKPLLVPEPDQLSKDELAENTKPLPGEQDYLKAIDALTSEIESQGEANMKPSLRAEYERNLAVVDQAIASTRRTARSNPKDPDAAQFLYSSYQSKLDLLNTVAQQVRPTIATR